MQQKRCASNGSRFFCYGNDVITLPFLCAVTCMKPVRDLFVIQ